MSERSKFRGDGRERTQRRRDAVVKYARENEPNFANMKPGSKCDQCGRRLSKGYADMWEDVTLCREGTGCQKKK